eukprot:SAG22_NODE_4209_length_1345_cov_1.463082_2_plen_55_part_00
MPHRETAPSDPRLRRIRRTVDASLDRNGNGVLDKDDFKLSGYMAVKKQSVYNDL